MLPPGGFWDSEQAKLWDELGPLLVNILYAGGQSGAEALPDNVQILMNWDVFNQDAIAYLQGYRLSWVKGISDTTRKQAIDTILQWIYLGEDMPMLEARLIPIFGKGRAKQIAVTEVTRIYAEGNILSWKSTGIIGSKVWQTAMDERVCPICGPLQGMEVPLDSDGFTTEVGGLGIYAPPAHPNCRCWLQPVVDEKLFRRSIRQSFGSFGDQEIDAAVAELRAWQPKITIKVI